MKPLIALLLLAVVIQSSGQDFAIPQRTTSEKHRRTIFLSTGVMIAGVSIAKKSGISARDYGTSMGDLFKTGWRKEDGFARVVRGTMFNFESMRHDDQPPMEILEQSESKVSFKVPMFYSTFFKDGPYYGVTLEEYNDFVEVIHQRIAAQLGASFEMELLPESTLKITITKANQ